MRIIDLPTVWTIVIDSLATVVCREEPGAPLLDALWRRLRRTDAGWALGTYEGIIGDAQLLGKASYDN